MKYLKILTAFISLFYLAFTFYSNLTELKSTKIVSINTATAYIIASSLLYMILLFVLALSWKLVLESLSNTTLLYKIAWVHSKSMIYKYIPGNVFHYVARHVEARKEGILHKTLIHSNILEVAMQIFASLAVSSFALIFIEHTAVEGYLHHIDIRWAFGIGSSGILLLFIISKYTGINIANYMQPLLLHVIFFIGIGYLTYLIINNVLQIEISFSICIFLYSIAWVVGFITPGAPGGLGVRESLFIVLSNGILAAPDALVASALLRIVTITGELLAYIIASLFINKFSDNQLE